MDKLQWIKECYYNCLCNEILKTIMISDSYKCQDYEEVKKELENDLRTILEDHSKMKDKVKELRKERNSYEQRIK